MAGSRNSDYARGMARPREFDENEVLDRALETFWSKGFDGTSMEDLVEATGLGRASLYGAFGDKEKLFTRVLEHYLVQVEAASPCAAAGDDEVAALRSITRGWVTGTCSRAGPRGCFLSLAALEGGTPPVVREALVRRLRLDEKKLAGLIAAGQKSGRFRSRRDAADLARMLVVVQQGVSTLARAGAAARDLERAVAEALDHVIG